MLRMNVKMKMARMTIEDAWAIDATTMAVNPRFYIQDCTPFLYTRPPFLIYKTPFFITRHPFITRPLVLNIDDPPRFIYKTPMHTYIYIYQLLVLYKKREG